MRTFLQALPRVTLARFAVAALMLPSAVTASQAAEPPAVISSVGPVGSLAAAVMRGVGSPTVLLPAGASPHAYALRPSDARALADADLVLWVGEALETFLEEPLHSLADAENVVELMGAEGLILHPTRAGGIWESGHEEEHGHGHEGEDEDEDKDHHGHEDEHGHADQAADDHDHGNVDPHLWLDPRNAAVMVDRIAAALAMRDPARAATYRANATAAKAEIEALDRELADALGPVRGRPYVVFHDAYQYLERRYGLTPLGAVTVGPERGPGARRLGRLRDEIVERGAVCAFREPQFAPRLLESLGADTGIRIGVLDPLGTEVAPSPDGYARLMRSLAAALVECLEGHE